MRLIAILALIFLYNLCRAATPPATNPPPPPNTPSITLDTVLVSGQQSGPGMWRVQHGDHVLWILGTQSPLPRKMEWYSDAVAETVLQSQEIIGEPGVNFSADIGRVRGLFLLPSLFAARKIPDEGTLRDVLPEALYTRWSALKAIYMPRSRKVERWRPIFAAGELYGEAIEEVGLTRKDLVWPVVEKLAKKHKLPITSPKVDVKIEAPREAIREFATTGIDDTGCFATTLERLETDLGDMKARANAWAEGRIDILRALPFPDQNAACRNAILAASVSETNGLQDLPQRVEAAWLESASAALEKNASTFAILPIAQLLREDGPLAKLRARGYRIDTPEELDAGEMDGNESDGDAQDADVPQADATELDASGTDTSD